MQKAAESVMERPYKLRNALSTPESREGAKLKREKNTQVSWVKQGGAPPFENAKLVNITQISVWFLLVIDL